MTSHSCRYCLAPINWLTSPTGLPVAVNPEPIAYELLDSRSSAWVVHKSGVVRSAHDLEKAPSRVLLSHRCAEYLEAKKDSNLVPLHEALEPTKLELEAVTLLSQLRSASVKRTRVNESERESVE